MRIYSAADEETIRAGKLLKEWAADGLLSGEQYQRLKQETVADLRTTNIFLRLVFFFFAVICIAALGALFAVIFLSSSAEQKIGVFLLFYAAVCYAAAEIAVSHAHLYRHGIEEALAACSVGCSCLGMELAFFSGRNYYSGPDVVHAIVPITGVVFSLWIWHRFGLWYAFPAAMIFAVAVPDSWTWSHTARLVILAMLYAVGLISVVAISSRHKRDYIALDYSLAEAFLWLGIYLVINLQLSSLHLRMLWAGDVDAASRFPASFYWTTWVLTWLIPPAILARGIRKRDRFVMAAGSTAFVLTLVTNKPYLGWARHTWDPMLLGLLLIGISLVVRRWLSGGLNGVRAGFTAARLTGKDKRWMNVGSAVFGLVTPQSVTPSPQAKAAEVRFGGGASGGGGAGGEF